MDIPHGIFTHLKTMTGPNRPHPRSTQEANPPPQILVALQLFFQHPAALAHFRRFSLLKQLFYLALA